MVLHRTPVHRNALLLVQEGGVVWRQAGPPAPIPRRSEGFSHANGSRFKPNFLVALWELKFAGLIEAGDDLSVSLTVDGKARLAEWDATRQAVKR